MLRVLRPEASRNWTVRAAGLEWSCWTTAVHVAHDLLAYSGQLAGEARSRYLRFDLSVSDDSTPSDLLDVVGMTGAILATVVSSADPSARAWHYGSTDPVGFAAMGVGETIVHTFDIAEGLGLAWQAPSDLCLFVLDRLFPGWPPGDPVDVLLWSTGRRPLGDAAPVAEWVWKAAR
ncbi:MAG TPA: hypothetical protein VNY84_00810 [Acidimicrobiales bacterium]|jgi:hypothetical protein|nr:hypothetical protein [Acidimicrobiales bacterium]